MLLDSMQEHRAEQAAERLRVSVALREQVLRDGCEITVRSEDLVPGDVVLLAAGDLVPADGRVLEAKDFFVNEALLTGESYPTEKHGNVGEIASAEVSEASNAAFMGTSVISGSAKLLVYATGKASQLGEISGNLCHTPPPAALERGTYEFGLLIVRLTVLLVLFVLMVNVLFHRPLLESFLFALALAVGLTPELLPMIVSVTLARGALRMAKERVIVKRLAAIHDLGISVESAVDVAKDAADIVLLDRDLGVLERGVHEGRRTFANIMKYIMMGTSSNFGNMFSMAGASLILPFLPMLPVQVLLNNFLYDLSEVPIPMDNVDEETVAEPRHWDMRFIRNFMLVLRPVSSIFDFLTFGLLILFFHASESLFQTGWFIESLATQVLVIFVIRTHRNPLYSRPNPLLAATSLAVVAAGILLPYSAFGRWFGFVPPPPAFLVALGAMVIGYLLLAESVKRWFYRRQPPQGVVRAPIVRAYLPLIDRR